MLDEKQRLVFIEYCRIQAESAAMIAKQMESQQMSLDDFARRERSRAAAYYVVMKELQAVETEQVEADDVAAIEDLTENKNGG